MRKLHFVDAIVNSEKYLNILEESLLLTFHKAFKSNEQLMYDKTILSYIREIVEMVLAFRIDVKVVSTCHLLSGIK